MMGVAVGRHRPLEEAANVSAFIASDVVIYVTGALRLVDGGVTPANGGVGKDIPWLLSREPKGTLDLEHSQGDEKDKDVHMIK